MPQLHLSFIDLPVPETRLWEQLDGEHKQIARVPPHGPAAPIAGASPSNGPSIVKLAARSSAINA